MKEHQHNHERKTLMVVLLTALTMFIEIYFGIRSKSMALLADGIHMGSHVLAIGISWMAYFIIRKNEKKRRFSLHHDRLLALSGYTSGLVLLIFAFVILFEAIQRFVNPQRINFHEAIYIAIIGLAVNLISAVLLHHKQEQTDHNIRAAYLHVVADALTSISAIIGLLSAKIWNISYVDTIAAIISSIVIIKWAFGLLTNCGKELLETEQTQSD